MHDRAKRIIIPSRVRWNGSCNWLSRVKPNILIVDDDVVLGRALARTLDKHFAVHLATDCSSALELARRVALDGAVVDLNLPDGDGLGLVNQLRDAGFAGPVLVASGDATDPGVGFARWSATVQSSLVKPYSAKELVAALKRQLGVRYALASSG